MSYLATRLSLIQPSPTLAMTAKASQMKAEGIDVIALSAGEPDFDTPDHIKEAAKIAMDKGLTKYTAVDGLPDLKKAIQAKFKKDNSLDYDLDQLMAATGGKQVIFNALMATINPGDEVIIPAPYWVSYPDMVNLFGGVPKIIQCPEVAGFKLTPALLESAITLNTKWLILNSPSNPTGELYSQQELEALGKVLERHPHIMVMCDDIYEYLVYDNQPFMTLASVCPGLQSRCLIVNGVSKSYSMTGWRLGYGAGPKPLIKAMTMLQSQSTSNPCSITQAAAIAAINGDRSFLKDWCQSFAARRNLTAQLINDIPGLACRIPQGAFYLYINCQGILGKRTPSGQLIENDNQFAQYLLAEAFVAVVSGDAFGLSPYFRISYATSDAVLKQACLRIREAVEKLV
ncbi:pyridoxal phosphate-dependent aminotransferase [Candidatus Odyssella thessalonicensis]|uniref:pyridoxal phosphate-dependent aminotransferase n=1 Tax=Candidatus Odyssella thessalonicensis TaxID=84647 RepID=UPI000225BAF7|nr:pyridoxal phosphate-dependent aminotransferase [Candidatus Odyssella thessalonicensis]